MQAYSQTIFVLRIIERFALTGIILAIAFAVLIAFWRTVHRIDFSVTREKVGVAGATLIATPVLVLLTLIGFTWVVLTNPISIETETRVSRSPNQTGADPLTKPDDASVAPETTRRSKYVGIVPLEKNVATALFNFNCALARVPNLTSAETDAIKLLKADELYWHWPSKWGDAERETFYKWAIDHDGRAAPKGDVLAMLDDLDPVCKRNG
jgi:hypothetical protein